MLSSDTWGLEGWGLVVEGRVAAVKDVRADPPTRTGRHRAAGDVALAGSPGGAWPVRLVMGTRTSTWMFSGRGRWPVANGAHQGLTDPTKPLKHPEDPPGAPHQAATAPGLHPP